MDNREMERLQTQLLANMEVINFNGLSKNNQIEQFKIMMKNNKRKNVKITCNKLYALLNNKPYDMNAINKGLDMLKLDDYYRAFAILVYDKLNYNQEFNDINNDNGYNKILDVLAERMPEANDVIIEFKNIINEESATSEKLNELITKITKLTENSEHSIKALVHLVKDYLLSIFLSDEEYQQTKEPADINELISLITSNNTDSDNELDVNINNVLTMFNTETEDNEDTDNDDERESVVIELDENDPLAKFLGF